MVMVVHQPFPFSSVQIQVQIWIPIAILGGKKFGSGSATRQRTEKQRRPVGLSPLYGIVIVWIICV